MWKFYNNCHDLCYFLIRTKTERQTRLKLHFAYNIDAIGILFTDS